MITPTYGNASKRIVFLHCGNVMSRWCGSGWVADDAATRHRSPGRGLGGRRAATACVSPACVPLQLSSTGGNLIGPELSPMRRSRPAVARRLSIRAPRPERPSPPANRISSRRHCVPRRLNAFVSPDAKTTHSFRAPVLPAPATTPHRAAPRRTSPILSLHIYSFTSRSHYYVIKSKKILASKQNFLFLFSLSITLSCQGWRNGTFCLYVYLIILIK